MNITAHPDTFKLEELTQASELIYNEAHEDAHIKIGTVMDENAGDELRVTIIATGIGKRDACPKAEVVDFLNKKKELAGPEEKIPALQGSRGVKKDSGMQQSVLSPDEMDWNQFEIPTFLRKKAD